MPAKLLHFFSPLMLAAIVMACGCRATGPDKVWEAEELLRSGKNAEALTLLQEAVQLTPRSAPAWNYLGVAYQRMGDHSRAVQSYNYALTLDQNLASAKLNLGLAHLETGNYTAAGEALVTYTSLRPHDTNGFLRLAQAYLGQAKAVPAHDRNRYYDAVSRALDRSGASAETFNMRGLLATYRGRSRDAYTNFVGALQKSPKYTAARVNLAVLHQSAFRDPAGALAIYKEIYASAPTGVDTFSLQRAIASLELELSARFAPAPAPTVITQRPPVIVVTNPPVVTSAPQIVVTNSPPPTNLVVIKQPPATSAPPAVVQKPVVTPKPAETKPPVVVQTPVVTNTPPAVTNKPPALEVAKNDPTPPRIQPEPQREPEKPIAQPEPEPEPVRIPQPQVAVTTPPESPVTTPSQTAAPEPKTGVLQKLNPANWFDRKPGPKPPAVAGRDVPRQEARVQETTTLPTPTAPTYPRYRYASTIILNDGDRTKARPHFLAGLDAHTSRKYPEAIAAYKKALAEDPRYFEAHHNIGLAATQLNDFGTALSAFERAIHLEPVSAEARINFATALDAAGYAQDAEKELERALAADSKNVKGHLLLARLNADRLQNIPKAKEHYRKVLELDPRHPRAVDIRYWLAANP